MRRTESRCRPNLLGGEGFATGKSFATSRDARRIGEARSRGRRRRTWDVVGEGVKKGREDFILRRCGIQPTHNIHFYIIRCGPQSTARVIQLCGYRVEITPRVFHFIIHRPPLSPSSNNMLETISNLCSFTRRRIELHHSSPAQKR